MAHESGGQIFGMDDKGIRTSSQDDAENGYNIHGREILNFGKELYELSFVCAPTLRLRECNCHYKHNSTMEGAVVRLMLVLSGKVRVAWTPTPLGKDTP